MGIVVSTLNFNINESSKFTSIETIYIFFQTKQYSTPAPEEEEEEEIIIITQAYQSSKNYLILITQNQKLKTMQQGYGSLIEGIFCRITFINCTKQWLNYYSEQQYHVFYYYLRTYEVHLLL